MKLPQGDGPSIRLCQREPGDGQPFPNPVMEGLPTIRPERDLKQQAQAQLVPQPNSKHKLMHTGWLPGLTAECSQLTATIFQQTPKPK